MSFFLSNIPVKNLKLGVLLVGNYLDPIRYSPPVSLELAFRLRAQGWKVLLTSTYENRFLRLLDIVATVFLKRDSYQIAHIDVFSGLAFLWAEVTCWALRFLQKPYVLTLRGGNLPMYAKKWPGRVRSLLSSAAVVTAPSQYLFQEMQPYCPSLEFLPNPINLPAYSFQERKQVAPCLVWLRAFHHIYNPSLAPRVLALLINEFPDVKLTMFGPDKRDGSFELTKRVAQDLGMQSRIDCPGAVPKEQVPESLQIGDIFLNTTNIDNTPVSVMEAMACGLCVVTTNVGGLPYLLKNGVDALLVPPDDPQAMANAIRRLLTEPELAEKLSANARHKVEGFDWSVILPQWESLFVNIS
jgi:glycosyltransferase involved in cell wall biosynthesis